MVSLMHCEDSEWKKYLVLDKKNYKIPPYTKYGFIPNKKKILEAGSNVDK